MSFVSNGLADIKWENTLEASGSNFRDSVWDARKLLRAGEPDWLIDALHQPHWRRDHIADAIAYNWFSYKVEAGHVYLAVRRAGSWAAANSELDRNQAAFRPTGVVAAVRNGNQGYDGRLGPQRRRPLGMRKVFLTDEDTPADVPITYFEKGPFPLEVGSCTLSKSIAILSIEGRLARLPYPMLKIEPCVFFLGLRPHARHGLGGPVAEAIKEIVES